MQNLLTTQNILFILTIATAVFAVYRSYREPDIKADKDIAILALRLDGIDKKMGNDLPHIDAKIEMVRSDVVVLGKEIVALRTIIEERIPRR